MLPPKPKCSEPKCSCGWPRFVVKAEVENLKLFGDVVSADVSIIHACKRCKKVAKSTTVHGECQIDHVDTPSLSVQIVRKDKDTYRDHVEYRICFAVMSTCSHGYTKECYRGFFKVSEKN